MDLRRALPIAALLVLVVVPLVLLVALGGSGDDDDEFRREVRERNSIPGVCREPPLPPACMELRDGRLHLREGP